MGEGGSGFGRIRAEDRLPLDSSPLPLTPALTGYLASSGLGGGLDPSAAADARRAPLLITPLIQGDVFSGGWMREQRR